MLGVSRSVVARRWTLPLIVMWAKLLTVGLGFLSFTAHAFDSPQVPPISTIGPPRDGLLWIEAWGISLLAAAAIASLLRARRERARGLSPQVRGVFWTCIGGIEAVGAAAWGFVVWLYTAPYDPPAN